MKKPSFFNALLVIAGAFAIIVIPPLLYSVKVQPLFLLALSFALLVLRGMGYGFAEMQEGMILYCRKGIPLFVMLLCVGAMIGTWNSCGTIPLLTLFGMSYLPVPLFPLIAFGGCFLFAFLTGTVFGACGTAGVVFMSMGRSMGMPEELCLGAITAGAFLGYGISPLSDCTNLVSSAVGVELSKVIGSQCRIIVPTVFFCAVVYTVFGLRINPEHTGAADLAMALEIREAFRIGFLPMLPPLLMAVLMGKRQPPVLALLAGTVSGVLLSWGYQKNNLGTAVMALWNGPKLNGSGEAVQTLFGGGGMSGMADTVILFLLAFSLFGVFDACGIIDALVEPALKLADSRLKATVITMLFGFCANLLSASAMCSFIFTMSCLAPLYEKKGWDLQDLIRAGFVGCLYLSLPIFWHSNVITPSALLGVDSLLMSREMFIPHITAILLLALQGFSLDKKWFRV